MSLPDTPNLASRWCPLCSPERDPTLEILHTDWCEGHAPSRRGIDEDRAVAALPETPATLQDGGTDNARWCALLHPRRNLPAGRPGGR